MSSDPGMQHFGQPEEPGAPGVQRYRKARAALAAYKHPDGKKSLAQRADALYAALKALMPTYRIVETTAGRETKVVADNLPDLPAAQQWIASNDPAARRVLRIEVEEKSA